MSNLWKNVLVHHRSNLGFTLIELLTTIAVLSVLFALAVAPLRTMRANAAEMKCVTHARSCAQMTALYSGDYQEAFPIFGRPTIAPNAFENGGVGMEYFAQAWHWPIAMRRYSNDAQFDASWFCPRYLKPSETAEIAASNGPSWVYPSTFFLAFGTLSDPGMWEKSAPVLDTKLMRCVRQSEVRHPSLKGLFLEPIAYHSGATVFAPTNAICIDNQKAASRNRFTIVAMDLSARLSVRAGLRTGIRPEPGARSTPVLCTQNGVRGRDW